jgi:ATP-independent RNA helicase DbpA
LNNNNFAILNLHTDLLKNLSTLNYTQMTAIQAQSLPPILQGKDVIAQGKTGSGKTAAFGLGILNKLNIKHFRIQTLILCPTRELAEQVSTEIRRLARGIHNIKILTLCGGVSFGPQIGSLEHGAHIVVGTPGRIEDHLRKGTLSLKHISTLVLDEADRMLDMGFQDSIDNIIDQVPSYHRQTLLFSATFPNQMLSIADRIMRDPILIRVEGMHDNSTIEQHFYQVKDNNSRLQAIQTLLLHYRPESTVIFCNTKITTKEVTKELSTTGFDVLAIHGDLEQVDRDQALLRFVNKSTSILVATNVAARGLDIDSLDAVFNYDIADDPEQHLHRIGRTGRAGQKGMACSLMSDKDAFKISALEHYLEAEIKAEELPKRNELNFSPMQAPMATLRIDGGKKQKVRAGDILGALTGEHGLQGKDVGKIQLMDNWAYIAIKRELIKTAVQRIANGKIKGRIFRVRQI